MSRTLVIGATGHVGREVVAQLVSAGAAVRAMVRRPDKASFPPQVEVVRGDLTVLETLDACLENIDSVFLVWIAPRPAVDAALERILGRTRRIVFLSAPLKTPHPFFQSSQPSPISDLALHIERLIESSPCEWTFLRPGMFAVNAVEWWGPQTRAGDIVRWPYLSVPCAPIDPRDIGAVGVLALTTAGHSRAEYVLTGPESLTHAEQIATLGRALGRTLRIEEMSPEEAPQELQRYLPPFAVNMLLRTWAGALGHPAFLTSTFQELMGRPPRTFFEWVTDHAAVFARVPQAHTG
jgi:uncharacterized protein YbjT (DUF2867 family)